MKYRYRFHPYEYALGENEKFYSDMEAKGFRLVKRGAYLSKFVPTEPNRARYRIEVVSSGMIEQGSTMPPEQRAVYEDCGWEYISGRNLLHIFRAPEGSDAPEFYADPAEQAATLKSLRQQAFLAVIPMVIIILCNMLFTYGGPQRSLNMWYRALIEQTYILLACGLIMLQAACFTLWNMWRINRTYRTLKKGIPLDHAPKGHMAGRPPIVQVLICITTAVLILLSIQWGGTKGRDLPLEADGPYLLLKDLDYDMERRPAYRPSDTESNITHTSSLLADYWDVFETVGDESVNNWLYQDIYRLHNPQMTDRLVTALRHTTTFGRDPEDCTKYVMENMEAWVYRDMEIVAVQGNMVAHITGWNGYCSQNVEKLLSVLQKCWAE